jgi:hypothetical protein
LTGHENASMESVSIHAAVLHFINAIIVRIACEGSSGRIDVLAYAELGIAHAVETRHFCAIGIRSATTGLWISNKFAGAVF